MTLGHVIPLLTTLQATGAALQGLGAQALEEALEEEVVVTLARPAMLTACKPTWTMWMTAVEAWHARSFIAPSFMHAKVSALRMYARRR
jgi:hypothetical protein